jgi:hypothetical protein
MSFRTRNARIALYKVVLAGLLFGIAGPGLVLAQTVKSTDDGTVLKQIIIFGRHSIRSSTFGTNTLNLFSANPYPGVAGGANVYENRRFESLQG